MLSKIKILKKNGFQVTPYQSTKDSDLQKKIGKKLCDIGLGKDFLVTTLKTGIIKETINWAL